jgi:hypothetical protein
VDVPRGDAKACWGRRLGHGLDLVTLMRICQGGQCRGRWGWMPQPARLWSRPR